MGPIVCGACGALDGQKHRRDCPDRTVTRAARAVYERYNIALDEDESEQLSKLAQASRVPKTTLIKLACTAMLRGVPLTVHRDGRGVTLHELCEEPGCGRAKPCEEHMDYDPAHDCRDFGGENNTPVGCKMCAALNKRLASTPGW